MAESRLKVVLQATGTARIKAADRATNKLKVSVQKLNTAFKQTGRDSLKAAASVKKFGQSCKTAASRGVGRLTEVLGKFGVAITAVAAAGGLARLIRGSAIATAELGKLRVALENVAGSQTTRALEIIRGTVDDFNTPIVDATRGFTQLAAAGDAAGFTINDLEKTFRGLTAANKALGGNTEQLKGILLATTQVFSKGKVAAEELRGQIGERLPGAFSEFAAATGRSTKELDKALQDGEVSLQDFVLFAERLLDKYEEDAQIIADGPAEAGARLEKELADLNVAVGGELARLGAKFQTFAAEAVRALRNVFTFLDTLGRQIESKLGGLPADALEKAIEQRDRARKNLGEARFNLKKAKETLGIDPEEIKRLERGVKIFERFESQAQATIESLKFGPGLNDGIPILPPTIQTNPLDEGGGSSSGSARKSGLSLEDRERERAEERLLRLLQSQREAAIGIVNAQRGSELSAIKRIFRENQLLQLQIEQGEEVANTARAIRELMDEGVDFNTAFDLVQTNQEFKKLTEETGKLTNESKALAEVWNGFGQEVTNVLDAFIQGTEDWNSVLKDTLRNLSKVLLNAGLNFIGAQNKGNLLGQLLGFRANGGPVSSGRPYIVGERGPELFTPSVSGNITPNGALGGSTVVNITVNENGSSSSNSQGDSAKEALALGRLVESSVVAIINREKRPGGILTRA